MTRVWDESKQKGSALLLLLAIADYAKDDGTGAWPSIETLAKKTRMGRRNVQKLLRKLEDEGELIVYQGKGPKYGQYPTNLYNIIFPQRANAETPPNEQRANGSSPFNEQRANAETPQRANGSSHDPLINPLPLYDDEMLGKDFGKAMQLYEQNINTSEAPITYQEMSSDPYASLPFDWWQEAIKIAADNNARRWPYIRTILDRSIAAGASPKNCPLPSKPANGNDATSDTEVVDSLELPAPIKLSADEATWQQVQAQLRNQMTQATYDAIIAHTHLTRDGDGAYIVACASPRAAEWLAGRWRDAVTRALAGAVGADSVKIDFEVLELSK